jgi:predicted  nucleic acid-binding Zn-ribbon protein
MVQRRIDPPERVLKHTPKGDGHTDTTRLEEAGQAIVTQIQRAADLANEDCDRAMSMAHRLSIELAASEDRTHQLQSEIELLRERAVTAERWLLAIQKEIEEKLIARRSSDAEGG